MPSSQAHLTLRDVRDHVHRHVFGTAGCDVDDAAARDSVGIELEWLTSYRDHRTRLRIEQVQALMMDITPLPGGSRLTVEPGGQLELSSARFDTVEAATTAVAQDLFELDQACAHRRIELIALGSDPEREPDRVLDAPRYAAMEAFFDHEGRAGRTMMCNTASIQVNIGLGPESDVVDRWLLAHALGPTLIACFANSPFAHGSPSGWQSTRLRAWWTLDPSRAAPPDLHGDPVERWIEYALAARVMLVRTSADAYRAVTEPLTFGQWMTVGHELGWPTIDDFAYHLTTLFPPVRPRGWFELRVIDALPTPFWNVAVALTHQLLTDPRCHDAAAEAVAGTERLWIDAAQLGLGHPALARAARSLFEVALASMAASSPDSALTDVVGGYYDRWVVRGRTPADDRLDAWRRDGTLCPPRESPVPYARELLSEIDLR